MKWLLIIFMMLSLITSCKLHQPHHRALPVDTKKAVENYLNLSNAYYQRKMYEQALTALKRAKYINPNSAAVLGMFGLTYQALGENSMARKYFKEALSKSNITGIRNNYAIFLLETGEHQAAYNEFKKTAADIAYTYRSKTFENMGITSLRLQDYDQAIVDFNNALRLNEASLIANKELAILYFQKSNGALALKHFKNYIEHKENITADDYRLGINIAKNNNLPSYANTLTIKLNSLLLKK